MIHVGGSSHQGFVRTFLEGFYPMLPTPQVSLKPESLVLTLLEILGCLPFQESVVLNYAVLMPGVEPGFDARVRGSGKLLYCSVLLKLCPFFSSFLKTLKHFQDISDNRSLDLLLHVVDEEDSGKFKCSRMSSVFQFQPL